MDEYICPHCKQRFVEFSGWFGEPHVSKFECVNCGNTEMFSIPYDEKRGDAIRAAEAKWKRS